MRIRFLMATTFMLALVGFVQAHHSLMDYDQNTIVTIKGTIGEVKWQNPHAVIVVQVKNPDGSSRSIQVEIAPPNALARKGIDTALLKIGDAITLDVWMPKGVGRSSDLANGRTLTLADGRHLDVGDSLNWTLLTTPPTPTR